MSAWSFTTISDDRRQYAGNHGYADDLARHYAYDSYVPNYKNVAVGDRVLLRDHDFILGTALVEAIEVEEGVKERLKCPGCGNTGLKERKQGGVNPIERTAGQVTSVRQCSGRRTQQVGHSPGWSAVGGDCTDPR